MKLWLLLLLFPTTSFTQETKELYFYGNIGYGFSIVDYNVYGFVFPKNFGLNLKMGLAVNYKNWVVKVDRSINNPLMEPPPEKINANSILFGYSFQPFQSVSEIYIIPKFGIGKVENMKRGKLINYSLTSYGFESILENGNSVAAEIDIELKLTRYIGFYLSSFANFNNIRNIYGFNSGIFSRYFLTAT